MLEEKVYTVSELTEEIKEILEKNYPLIWVEGEVSNLRLSPRGNYYFTLKDEKAQLQAVLFKGRARPFLSFLKNGAKVLCNGSLTVYEPRGEYQLEVLYMEERGLGALYAKLEELKRKLEEEGLFDEKFKKPIPLLPRKIGVVTSPRGAAIRDILNIIKRRFSKVHIIIYPSKVQGEGAAEEIVEGIRFFNKTKLVDVIIVARGGGSMEDLWAFNEEIVARAIFESEIPVISAVGHQRDYTIADFVADLRAPTPSAAAELVVKTEKDLREKLFHLTKRLEHLTTKKLSYQMERFHSLKRRLELRDPRRIVRDSRLRLDELVSRLSSCVRKNIEAKKHRKALLERLLVSHSPKRRLPALRDGVENLKQKLISILRSELEGKKTKLKVLSARLESFSPKAPLERGYAICYGPDGRILKDAFRVKKGTTIRVELARGALVCQVKDIKML